MNIVKTVAPVPIEELKKYFVDKETYYHIDAKNSTLKNEKLLTYLGNLNLPADVDISGLDNVEFESLMLSYLKLPLIVDVPSLEIKAIEILLEAKQILNSNNFTDFIKDNQSLIDSWLSKIDSLTLYNLYSVNVSDFKDYVESYPKDETDDLTGVNFVSLIKHKEFYLLYQKIDETKLKNYVTYFNEYMFKGKNLYEFWANEQNPLFLLTFGISSGMVEKLGKIKEDTDVSLI